MFYTTLNEIREYGPSTQDWQRLLKYLGKMKADDEPLSFKTILDSNGLDTAIWALRTIKAPEVRLFAVRCIRQVPSLLFNELSLNALDIAEAYAIGEVTDEELIIVYAKLLKAEEIVRWYNYDTKYTYGLVEVMAAIREAIKGDACSSAHKVAYTLMKDWDDARLGQKEDFIAIFCSED